MKKSKEGPSPYVKNLARNFQSLCTDVMYCEESETRGISYLFSKNVRFLLKHSTISMSHPKLMGVIEVTFFEKTAGNGSFERFLTQRKRKYAWSSAERKTLKTAISGRFFEKSDFDDPH